ncbi:unnamed protein product [Clonostachys byssicola]|uniref:FAD-binding domain-containing protein n=1 Tax=Clonostachys byssicola TaxID=160290 RepID=A0A9N9Y0J1_9HYPO|nr:unnamed protein product [Clonostachys byssicola]
MAPSAVPAITSSRIEPEPRKGSTPAIVTSIKASYHASYPTRSLQFLRKLEAKSPEACSSVESVHNDQKLQLQVTVVGAGIGGLATSIALAREGHAVTILEQASALAEVGAGIQIPPNSSRLLLKWGLGPLFEGKAVEPRGITFRRWETGNAIGYTRLIPDFRSSFEAPYYVIHRAHLHEALHETAVKLGVTVKLNSRVTEYNEMVPSIKMQDGTILKSDLIVAADGVKSAARKLILGKDNKDPIRTGFAVYRSTIDAQKMRDDPETATLLREPALNVWIGPQRHVMSYTIAAGKSFNLVLSHVDDTDPATWRPEDSLDNMRAQFEGWDPVLTKIIAMIDKTIKWPLLSGDPSIPSWISQSGKVIMLGDAAHAMVPYMSQGAAMAVEDGAALAAALSHVCTISDLPRALSVFDIVRRRRAGQMQEASLVNGKIWHFDDGPEQAARDEAMKPEVKGLPISESPNQWTDPVTQAWAYGYNAEDDIHMSWNQFKSRLF